MTAQHPRLAEAFERHRAGDVAAAEHAYRAVLGENPDDVGALNGLAGLFLTYGRPQHALSLSRRVVELQPDSVVHWSNLARAALGSSRNDEAAQAAQRACELGGEAVDDLLLQGNALRNLDRLDEAEAVFARAVTKAPSQLAPAYNLAITRLSAGQHARAVRDLMALSARFPEQVAVRQSLANALSAAGRFDEALQEYRNVTAQAPQFAVAWTNYGLTCLETGALDEAARALERALALRPGEPSAVAATGVLAQRAGDTSRAAQLLDIDRVVVRGELPLPDGVIDRAAWHAAIAEELLALPDLRRDRISKTTRGGRQTDNLVGTRHGAIGAFANALRAALPARMAEHAQRQRTIEPAFVAPPPQRWHLNLWATVLDPQGHQDPHLHPSGWLSGVYYLRTEATPDDPAGWIEFGAVPDALRGGQPVQAQALQPREGQLVTFPSYLYHRTVPHAGSALRISLAFDVVPLPV